MAEDTSFSAVLKLFRLAAGLSQEGLAARAGLSVRTISDLERGLHRAPHASTIDLLATTLALPTPQRAVLLAAAHPDLDTSHITERRPPLARSLPVSPTHLIGREPERSQARAALTENHSRLLTLTGPSGVGKTRLALQIAADLAGDFSDGAMFVDLAPMRDAALLDEYTLQALGLHEQRQTLVAEQLHAFLYDKQMLLVLDNFEHIREASSQVARLLAQCPHVAILVTSRVSLRIRGEQLLPLAPLPLDVAVTLFRERARAVRPDRELPQADVEAICERIDRLPLAIELAAAESRVFPLRSLREHLTQSLSFLRSGATDAPTRQQTMEAAIAWSYELLSDTQRRCFRALGVFVGGWTLEAARAVCWPEDADSASETPLTLAALVDASMALAEEAPDGTVRFHLLELLREFALARLVEAGEEQACRERHARYFAGMADAIMRFGPGLRARGADPAAELANARAALEWAHRAGEVALGLRLAGFGRIWHILGQMRDAVTWQERMLMLDQETRTHDQALAAPLSLRVERLSGLTRTLLSIGDYERAANYAAEALALAQRIDDESTICNAYMSSGMVAQALGDYDKAADAFTMGYKHTTAGDRSGLRARVLALLAQMERRRGGAAAARAHLEEALSAAQAIDNTWDAACIGTMLGSLVTQSGDERQATRYFMDALSLFRRFGSPNFSAWCLEGYAVVLANEERHVEATALCAAAASLRAQAQSWAPHDERVAAGALLATARDRLSETAFAQACAVGAALTHDAAIALALAAGARQLDAAGSAGDHALSDA